MHTVIIANEKMTQLFRDYKNLFVPFLKDGEISFCDWNEEGPDLETALPDLAKAIPLLEEKLQIRDYKIYNDHEMRIYDDVKSVEINSLLAEHHIAVEQMFYQKQDLETYFLDKIGGENHV